MEYVEMFMTSSYELASKDASSNDGAADFINLTLVSLTVCFKIICRRKQTKPMRDTVQKADASNKNRRNTRRFIHLETHLRQRRDFLFAPLLKWMLLRPTLPREPREY
jgi:hypothetical protein